MDVEACLILDMPSFKFNRCHFLLFRGFTFKNVETISEFYFCNIDVDP